MGINIKVEGVSNIISKFNNVKKQSKIEVKKAMRDIVLKIRRDAKSFAPIDTGFLSKNIVFSVKNIQQGVEGIIHSKAPYSIYQEFGTRRHGKQPFMQPAFEGNKSFINQRLRTGLIKAMLTSTKKA